MPTVLELCEKYYGTRDVYKLMGINKDALVKDGECRFVYQNCSMVDLFGFS